MLLLFFYQERAFLGVTTLRDLILKKPQGSGDFIEALLDITTSDLEMVGVVLYGCGLWAWFY